jgi:hypothetical protein
MKKWMKIIGALAVIGILALAYVWFFVYNKPHRDYENAKADHVLAAMELFEKYRSAHFPADSIYTGKVLQITGPLSKVSSKDSMVVAIFVFDQGMFGDEGIRCVMLPSHYAGLADYGIGSPITLKGYCTGYNDTDVIMENCSIIKESKPNGQ